MFVSGGAGDASSSLLAPKAHLHEWPDISFDSTVEVPVTTLAAWGERENIARVDGMWLDMQGYELAALKAAGPLLDTTPRHPYGDIEGRAVRGLPALARGSRLARSVGVSRQGHRVAWPLRGCAAGPWRVDTAVCGGNAIDATLSRLSTVRREMSARLKPAVLRIYDLRRELRFEARMLRSAIFTQEGPWPGYGLPFNGQRRRLQTIRQLIADYEPDVFLETGTFLGHTTRFFLGQGVPVWTVEVKRSFYASARLRLGVAEGLRMIRGNSPAAVRRLSREGFERPFFYLDAHWWSALPLAEELSEIAASWNEALIVIDDCKVPGDEGYAYETHAGVGLAADNLPIVEGMVIGYPAEPSEDETGARRGTLYIAHGQLAAQVLERSGSIRSASAEA